MKCRREDERKYSAGNIVISVNANVQEDTLIYCTSVLHTGALNADCRSCNDVVWFRDTAQALLEAIAPKNQTLNQIHDHDRDMEVGSFWIRSLRKFRMGVSAELGFA